MRLPCFQYHNMISVLFMPDASTSLLFLLPPQNQTRGLMGNWTFDIEDDFYLPDGSKGPVFDTSNIRGIHDNFGMKCKEGEKKKGNIETIIGLY